MSGFRINEDGLKSCLLHGCLPSHCGCPIEISQADRHVKQSVVSGVPFIIRMGGLPKGIKADDPGCFMMTWDVVRKPDGVTSTCIEFRRATADETASAGR